MQMVMVLLMTIMQMVMVLPMTIMQMVMTMTMTIMATRPGAGQMRWTMSSANSLSVSGGAGSGG